jgi:hypothetical protein
MNGIKHFSYLSPACSVSRVARLPTVAVGFSPRAIGCLDLRRVATAERIDNFMRRYATRPVALREIRGLKATATVDLSLRDGSNGFVCHSRVAPVTRHS